MSTSTINDTTVNPNPTNIKVTHDVQGNVIYPVTREEAVILRDGVLLSDRLNEFYTIRDVTDMITNQFELMDSQSEQIKSLIDQYDALTDDTLVFDDDLIVADTGVEILDYQLTLNTMSDTINEINNQAVMHIDDESIKVPVTTFSAQVSELRAELHRLNNRLNVIEATINNMNATDGIKFEDDETSNSVILVPELSEELSKMNNVVLGYAERIGRLEDSSEYAVVFEDEAIVDNESESAELDLVALRSALGDRSQLPDDTDVITLLLELKAQIDQMNQ